LPCHIKCKKINFGCGSFSNPSGGAYSAPPTPQLDLRGLLLKGNKEGREGRAREEGEGRAR